MGDHPVNAETARHPRILRGKIVACEARLKLAGGTMRSTYQQLYQQHSAYVNLIITESGNNKAPDHRSCRAARVWF